MLTLTMLLVILLIMCLILPMSFLLPKGRPCAPQRNIP